MKIKLILISVGVGVFGFAATFSYAWFSRPQSNGAMETAAADAARNASAVIAQQKQSETETLPATRTVQSLTEKQLKTLVYEVREKINDYNMRLKELDLREQRMQLAQDTLRKDIAEMSDLRVELASAVASLKSEQDKLMKDMLAIEQIEKDNLKRMAATYDKMDADAAGKILSSMIQNQAKGTGFDDAVKILYYMAERTKADVLASIAQTEPAVSAAVCRRLKQTVER